MAIDSSVSLLGYERKRAHSGEVNTTAHGTLICTVRHTYGKYVNYIGTRLTEWHKEQNCLSNKLNQKLSLLVFTERPQYLSIAHS